MNKAILVGRLGGDAETDLWGVNGSKFLEESLAILIRTPATLDSLRRDLPAAWTSASEGPGTWSPYVVIGHLIQKE